MTDASSPTPAVSAALLWLSNESGSPKFANGHLIAAGDHLLIRSLELLGISDELPLPTTLAVASITFEWDADVGWQVYDERNAICAYSHIDVLARYELSDNARSGITTAAHHICFAIVPEGVGDPAGEHFVGEDALIA